MMHELGQASQLGQAASLGSLGCQGRDIHDITREICSLIDKARRLDPKGADAVLAFLVAREGYEGIVK